MNKTAIKNFAIWARNKLIADVTYRAGLMGITESGIKAALPQSTNGTEFYDIGTAQPYEIRGSEIRQRQKLVETIENKAKSVDYTLAFKNVMEEVAYTWFNRLIAIRFMEVNDYLPSHVRVLSSETGKHEPDLVTNPFSADLEYTFVEEQQIMEYKNRNDIDGLFCMLFIKQCNALNNLLPGLFEKTSDYTELLLNISVIDQEGVVYHLVNDIREIEFRIPTDEDRERLENGEIMEEEMPVGQVEIIGWLYQYYNTEPKAEAFAQKEKIRKDQIPAVTQLFTPDWIVRYMVENSLGRLWVEGHYDNEGLKLGWSYYLEEVQQEEEVEKQLAEIRKEYAKLSPEDIKVMDPCMGSGHILVYCFDVLMQIYEAAGYSQRDAARSILEHNIYGLDIDDRAFQLAYFAIMMKARQYNRRILSADTPCHLHSICESNGINRNQLKFFGAGLNQLEKNNAFEQIESLIAVMHDAKEYGSILNVEMYDWDLLRRFVSGTVDEAQISIETIGIENTKKLLKEIIEVGGALAQKYHVVVTNPPYMAISNGNKKLNEFVKKNYPNSKADLFAVFIERCMEMLVKNGYQAMITQHAWMFLSSFEKLRIKLQQVDIVNMAHLGARAFDEISGEVVQTTTFVLRKNHIAEYLSVYMRLVDGNSEVEKESMFDIDSNCFVARQNDFLKIPGALISYWINPTWYSIFDKYQLLRDYAILKKGTSTGDNVKFIRKWFEIDYKKIKFDAINPESANQSGMKWFPINGGGERRKWYGNRVEIVNWENDGAEMKALATQLNHGGHWSRYIINPDKFFTEAIGWSAIASTKIGVRYVGYGFAFSSAAMEAFENDIKYIMGLINSVVADDILKLLAPTINFGVEQIGKIPIIVNDKVYVEKIVTENIKISKDDWDSFETSWDFKRHPLLTTREEMAALNDETEAE